ncbi:hypothetical protein ABT324_00480 [Saccharopolyspora sp. NPDC000359]|uniref:hypothetical protein n=1 Tax=Saccharopolyspora sp. NPDC000359 TaxID=3154251 RepID=UPI00332C3DD1
MTDHRALAEQLLTGSPADDELFLHGHLAPTETEIAEAQVHATLALVDALRPHRTAGPEQAALDLTPEQIAARLDLAGLLRIARRNAETVHAGQYGRSLGALLAFLAHIVEDPAQPLGLMPRHAAHIADHLAELARQHAAEPEVTA